LIDEYFASVVPRIKKVYAIEKQVDMTTDDGEHTFIGFIDLICDWEMDDGSIEKVLFDNKTASKPYPKNAVLTKQQLALYEYTENIKLAGYLVAIKDIKCPKRGPDAGKLKARIQILIDHIPEETQEKYIDILDETMHNVVDGNFEKNTDSCYAFGRPCEFYGICHHNKFDRVIKMED
jgi:hypothetical protein